MQFQRLKLSGFKSFVDGVEFRIDPGLTGIVGPNGCGKSNLLEAMRWVMGATSAKAMRGSGMDDVIFSGTDKRPSRNWAEVSLSIDNAQRLAPHPFSDIPVLDVSRRIERGSGSTYRINGKEVRARDVQLLFADASTGANSPALVRQGQISELIAAKPQNRRRVLEEAGGVSGLHTRRHEAELRLRAAEVNLERLEDIARELDTTLSRLKRDARQSEKYKKISSEIRALQKAILHAKWQDALAQFSAASIEVEGVSKAVETVTRQTALAQTAALNANEAIAPLREEEAVAATIMHRLNIEKARLELEEKQSLNEIERLKTDLGRLKTDYEREHDLSLDGAVQIERIVSVLERVRAEIAGAPSREPQLIKQVEASDALRAKAENEIEGLAAQLSALNERKRADDDRLRDAKSRFERCAAQLKATEGEYTNLGEFDQVELETLEAIVLSSQDAIDQQRQDLLAHEAQRSAIIAREAQARKSLRDVEDRVGRLNAEARGLSQILSAGQSLAFGKKNHNPILDKISAQKGYELALAAALGDDLNLSQSKLDDLENLAFWGEDFVTNAPPFELSQFAEITPLSRFVSAPAALDLRLKAIGIVDPKDALRLQALLPQGARLVSLDGDLWRWDGLIVRAKAPKPAAIRLEQRNRLEELESELDHLKPEHQSAQNALNTLSTELTHFENTIKAMRAKQPQAENQLRLEQNKLEACLRNQARFEANAQALTATLKRLKDDLAQAEQQLDQTKASLGGVSDPEALQNALNLARTHAVSVRSQALDARSKLEEERRETGARHGRERNLVRELEDWTRRSADSQARLEKLKRDQTRTQDDLTKAQIAPETFDEKRLQLVDSLSVVEKRLSLAREKLSSGETLRLECEQAVRILEKDASLQRELRAAAQARFEGITLRKDEVETTILDQTGLSPDALGAALKEEAIATPADASGAESLLSGLERERDELGPVNLRADEEASEYQTRLETISRERLDLTTAIAKLRDGIDELNAEGRERLLAAFEIINGHFKTLFVSLFGGGEAELRLIESDDPLEAGLEIFACPPGKRLSTMSLMSGGEQALTATALIFGVFLANPAPVCVLDEVDAPLDDANVDRYCRLLDEMRTRTNTRFITITHNPVTMARMDRLFGVTMTERGVSQLVSVDLTQAEKLVEAV